MIAANITKSLVKIPTVVPSIDSSSRTINFTIEKIEMQGVNDMEGFTREIKASLPTILIQELARK
jgi:predicted methyltransferase